MPFELGMTITWQKLNPSRHTWFVFESRHRRLQKSLSDLDGTDPNVHGATVEGVMRELCNAFVRRGPQPGVPEMMRAYRRVGRLVDGVMKTAGTNNLFEARVFRDLCFVAGARLMRLDCDRVTGQGYDASSSSLRPRTPTCCRRGVWQSTSPGRRRDAGCRCRRRGRARARCRWRCAYRRVGRR